MCVVSFARGVVCLGKSVAMRWARAARASFDVDAEKDGNIRGTLFACRDSRASGGSRRRRGRVGLIETPWRADRVEGLLADRVKLVDGPDAGALKDDTAKLLEGVKRSSSLMSGSRGSSPFSGRGV